MAGRRAFPTSTAALSASLAVCGGPPSTDDTGAGGPDRTPTAVIGYGNDGSRDPTRTASAFATAAHAHLCEGLVDTDPVTRAPCPALAPRLPADPAATLRGVIDGPATAEPQIPLSPEETEGVAGYLAGAGLLRRFILRACSGGPAAAGPGPMPGAATATPGRRRRGPASRGRSRG